MPRVSMYPGVAQTISALGDTAETRQKQAFTGGYTFETTLDTKAQDAAAETARKNLGEPGDFRVPDGGLFRPRPDEVYVPTAALVVEIVLPDDKTWEKLGFYAAHRVEELLIVDPQERRVHLLALQPNGEYGPIERSVLIALGPAELAEQIDWPE